MKCTYFCEYCGRSIPEASKLIEENWMLRRTIDAMVSMAGRQPCYRVANGVPQAMPRRIESVVRKCLKQLAASDAEQV